MALGLCRSAPAATGDIEIHTFGGSFDLPIPADPDASLGWMDDATIEVSDPLTILDLDVTLSITHTNVFDLKLILEGPSGTRVLLNDPDPFAGFFEGQDYRSTTFDDEAIVPIEEGEAPFEGRFRPIAPNHLSAFDGQDACGTWTLMVYDRFASDTGCLDAVTLTLTAPEPATVLLLLLGLPRLTRPRRSGLLLARQGRFP